jgi:hypothetical protein
MSRYKLVIVGDGACGKTRCRTGAISAEDL